MVFYHLLLFIYNNHVTIIKYMFFKHGFNDVNMTVLFKIKQTLHSLLFLFKQNISFKKKLLQVKMHATQKQLTPAYSFTAKVKNAG